MSEYVLAISRPGYDATDPATERKDFVFHSDNITFKIAKVLHFTSTSSQAHGLGYPPSFLFVRERTTPGQYDGGNDGYELGGSSTVYVDSTNVYYNDSVFNPRSSCYVFVLLDPLNE
jgi:hypothetical protein